MLEHASLGNRDLEPSVIACTECHGSCLSVLAHCLQMGGDHAAPEHVRLLLDCAELCSVTADFMLRGSVFGNSAAELCAAVCRACAADCDRFADDAEMRSCAQACRKCADACERVGPMARAA